MIVNRLFTYFYFGNFSKNGSTLVDHQWWFVNVVLYQLFI